MVTSSQCALAVYFVTIESDGVDSVTLHVCSSDGQVSADTSLTENLLQSLQMSLIELKFVHERNGILGVGCFGDSRMESVERHESDSTAFLLDHNFEDSLGCCIGVDDNMEQAIKLDLDVLTGREGMQITWYRLSIQQRY